MNAGDWLLLAVVIMALATFLFSVMRQREERKRERRDKILEWAVRNNAFALKYCSEAVKWYDSTRFNLLRTKSMNEYVFTHFLPERSWSVYTETLANILKSPKLIESVVNLRKAIQAQIKFLFSLSGIEKPHIENEAKRIGELNSGIHDAAVDVIEQIAKADTSDI